MKKKKTTDFLSDSLRDPMAAPTSTVAGAMETILTGGKNKVGEIHDRKKQMSRCGTKFSPTKIDPENDKGIYIAIQNRNMDAAIFVDDFNALATTRDAEKIFPFMLIKINEQCVKQGKLVKDVVEWSLQEMVDRGLYNSRDAARRGFEVALGVLSKFSLKGNFRRGRKNVHRRRATLFPTDDVSNSMCWVRLSIDVAWEFILEFFTSIPGNFFFLSRDTRIVLLKLCDSARQNGELDRTGNGIDFSLSLRAIQHALFLPDPKDTKNPGKDIKRRISRAIEEITHEVPDLHLEYHFGKKQPWEDAPDAEAVPIKTYLLGEIRGNMSGDLAQQNVAFHREKQQRIATARRKKEQILEAAKVKALATTLAKDQQQDEDPKKKIA